MNDQHARVFDGEGGSLRHEFNLLQHELKQAKKVIYEYEKGSKKDSVSSNKSLQEYIKQMSDLENENDRLKRIIRDSHDPSSKQGEIKIKAEFMVLKQEVDQLKSQNKLLKEEVKSKENVINSLRSGNPKAGGTQDVEAVEMLRRANERLMEQMVKLQDGMNSSMMSNATKQAFGGKSKDEQLKPKANWVKSEWVSKPESNPKLQGLMIGEGGLKSKFTPLDF